MNIAILGATSNIAKDLILNFVNRNPKIDITLFARNIDDLKAWLDEKEIINKISYIYTYESFSVKKNFDVIFNFVGIGDPAKAMKMGASIIDITYIYDSLALKYIEKNPSTKYIFLSSGAAYGSKNFLTNVTKNSKSRIDINDIKPQDWYSIAKLHAECRHRSMIDKSIIDIRVFNYINSGLDLSSKFLITDAIMAILNDQMLITSSKNISRDYIGPDDFYKLIMSLIAFGECNDSVDCFTKSPIDKFSMLDMLKQEFGLKYQIENNEIGLNATGKKDNYFSKNFKAKVYGYYPEYSSKETILKELSTILKISSIN